MAELTDERLAELERVARSTSRKKLLTMMCHAYDVLSLIAEIRHLRAAEARAEAAERYRKALEFYADSSIYEPHPHGSAFDRRDLSFHAKAALAASKEGG